MARSCSRKSASPALRGVSTSSPSSKARVFTALAVSWRPRPAGASGRLMTATTSCRDATSASREGSAAGGEPAKTTRTPRSDRLAAGAVRRCLDLRHRLTGPLRLADGSHRKLALLRVEPVDEEDAVEVVGLVLH